MRIITGDEGGLLKSIDLEGQRIVVAGRQERARGIRALCWSRGGAMYAAARHDGVVTLWEDNPTVPRLARECKGAVNEDVIGMASTDAHLARKEEEERLVVAHENGKIKVLAPWQSVVTGHKGICIDEWQVKGPLTCMACNFGSTNVVAAGGKERELGLYDVSTGAPVWEARNVAHDKLSLRQPVWVTAIHFLDVETGSEGGGAGRLVAIGTGYKQVRIYDVRAPGRRPVRAMELPEGYRITALASGGVQGATGAGSELVSGDAGGTVYRLDVGKMALLGRMEGPAGSVRGLARHPNPALPFVALAGLDRMARVYDLRRPRKEAFRFYLKQRLTAVLFAKQGRKGSKGIAEEIDEEVRAAKATGSNGWREMEDDVLSLDDEEEEEGEGGDYDGEEEEKAEALRRGRYSDTPERKENGFKIQRVYESEEEVDDGGGMGEDTSDGGDQDEEDEEDEEEDEEGGEEDDGDKVAFGRRNDGPIHLELNIVGGGDEEDEDRSAEQVSNRVREKGIDKHQRQKLGPTKRPRR